MSILASFIICGIYPHGDFSFFNDPKALYIYFVTYMIGKLASKLFKDFFNEVTSSKSSIVNNTGDSLSPPKYHCISSSVDMNISKVFTCVLGENVLFKIYIKLC